MPTLDILGEIWFTCGMTKTEAIAYLRKKQLLERLADSTLPEARQDAVDELDELEKPHEKDLTTEESSV